MASCVSNYPRPTSWSAHLTMLVLLTTLKCSLKALLSLSLSLSINYDGSCTQLSLSKGDASWAPCPWSLHMRNTLSTNPRAWSLRDAQQFWHLTCATPMMQQGWSTQPLPLLMLSWTKIPTQLWEKMSQETTLLSQSERKNQYAQESLSSPC